MHFSIINYAKVQGTKNKFEMKMYETLISYWNLALKRLSFLNLYKKYLLALFK